MRSRSVSAAWGILLAATTLTGCTTVPDIRLTNPTTGKTFTCSGESGREPGRWWDEMAKRTRDNCVKDLEAQGYVIVK